MTKTILRYFLSLILVLLSAGISVAKVPEVVLAQKKAVVTLYIEQNKKIIASGSGFIVDETGIIVTNNHVIEPWNKSKDSLLYIKNSEGTFLTPLELIASDDIKDVAILKVKEKNLPFISLSGTTPKEGEDVVVIGSPFGLETTITSGIISSIRGKDEFLQISAPISPGSSGSPVLNANGEAIGMATLLMEGGQNLNFAIPNSYIVAPIKNLSKEKLEDLEKRGILVLKKEEVPAAPPALESLNGEGTSHFVKVLSLQNAAGYSYIEYDESGEEGWVAVMADAVVKEKVIPGDYVVFPDSPPMTGFQSKALGKTFDKLIFAAGFTKVIINDAEFKSAKDKDAFIISMMIDYGCYTTAANKINKVLEKEPNNAEMYFLRAKFRTAQLKVAIEDTPEYAQTVETNKLLCQSSFNDLSNAISLNSMNDVYYAARGDLLTNDYQCNYQVLDKALDDYEAAIKLNPKVAEYYIDKGRIHQKLSQLPKLLECAKETVKLNPNREAGYYLYANYYKERQEFAKALEYVKKGLMFNNNIFSGTLLIDNIMRSYKKYDEAIKLYSDLIKKYPKSYQFYGNRASYYLKSENYKKAIADYSTAIDLTPKPEYYYSVRGDAYRGAGNLNAALSDFNIACNAGFATACEDIKSVRADIRRGPNWIITGSSNNTEYYFDKTTIAKNKSGNITVWIKGEITNKEEFIAEQEFTSYEKDKYKNVSHTLNHFAFDCEGKQIKSLNYLVYSETGNNIYSYSNGDAKFTSVIPNSIGAGFLDKVCKYSATKKVTKKK